MFTVTRNVAGRFTVWDYRRKWLKTAALVDFAGLFP